MVKIREYHFNSNYRKYTDGSKLFKIVEWFEYKILGRMFDMNYLLTKEDKETNFQGNPKFDYQYNPFSFSSNYSPSIRQNTVIVVNRLVAQKNTAAIIRIWSKIHNQAPDWQLVIAGEGTEYNELSELSSSLGLGDSLLFLGFRKDIPDLLLTSKIITLTSKYDGMALNLLEAMSQGVVPISYRTPYGYVGIITDGKDGVLVDYMDEEQFAEKLLELMRDPGRIERMSAAAKERANDFDVAKIAVEWMKKYKTLLRHHS